jgi:RND family efflux transporter MFP subunit
VDNRVETNTGAIHCRAVFPNTGQVLLPGMFVRVRLATTPPYKALLVSDVALMKDEGQASVFVVNEKNVIERRRVKTGVLHDGMRVIAQGLTSEDLVVVKGLSGVKTGMTVKPERVAMPSRGSEQPSLPKP